jgi:hypothetical protein
VKDEETRSLFEEAPHLHPSHVLDRARTAFEPEGAVEEEARGGWRSRVEDPFGGATLLKDGHEVLFGEW